MSSTNTSSPSGRKVYKDNQVWLAALLGGPLAGGFVIAENFRITGHRSSAKTAWICTILATVVTLAIMVFWSKTDIMRSIIFAACSIIASVLVRRYQSAKIQAYEKAGGQTHQLWMIVAIGLVGLFVFLLLAKALLSVLLVS